MNRFELFTMIFYALDLCYDDNPLDELGKFLGSMSPFTFEEIDSADSAIYEDFCNIIKDEKIEIEKSYNLAINYLKTIDSIDAVTLFCNTTEEEWIEGCKEYLAKPHKGENKA